MTSTCGVYILSNRGPSIRWNTNGKKDIDTGNGGLSNGIIGINLPGMTWISYEGSYPDAYEKDPGLEKMVYSNLEQGWRFATEFDHWQGDGLDLFLLNLFLPKKQYDNYYLQAANSIRWWVDHLVSEDTFREFRERAIIRKLTSEIIHDYSLTNFQFALSLVNRMEEDGVLRQDGSTEVDTIVQVHDYHLPFVGKYVRKLLNERGYTDGNIRISYTHHIPMTDPEVMTELMDIDMFIKEFYTEIYEALTHYDYVHYHIPEYADNLVSVLQNLFPEGSLDRNTNLGNYVGHRFSFNGQSTNIGWFPIGVAGQRIESILKELKGQSRVKRGKGQSWTVYTGYDYKTDEFSEDSVHVGNWLEYAEESKSPVWVHVSRIDVTKRLEELLDTLEFSLDNHLYEEGPMLLLVAKPGRKGVAGIDNSTFNIAKRVERINTNHPIVMPDGSKKPRVAWVPGLAYNDAILAQTYGDVYVYFDGPDGYNMALDEARRSLDFRPKNERILLTGGDTGFYRALVREMGCEDNPDAMIQHGFVPVKVYDFEDWSEMIEYNARRIADAWHNGYRVDNKLRKTAKRDVTDWADVIMQRTLYS